ncbi:unnamed protein product [Bursaphelenchus xylophilus]|uniref:(pine wood nematode) hypothetical protein n=1 Tax=Bursaphelenchus xylophilus TaxID=6326 RepID=A0A1I7RYU6_BURXY|nr:unnamed protein product [Bursaphelenchus xylophilus]CAG9092205.1 unnamed protein product [Bursaphelenchus xylophilus]
MKCALLLCFIGLSAVALTCQGYHKAQCEKEISEAGEKMAPYLHDDIKRQYVCKFIVALLETACKTQQCGPCEHGLIDCFKAQESTSKLVVTPEKCCSHCPAFSLNSILAEKSFGFASKGSITKIKAVGFSCPPMPLRAQRASPGTVAVHRNGFQVHTVNVRSIQAEGKIGAIQQIVGNESDQHEFDIPYTRPFVRFRMRWIDDAGKNHGLRWSDLTLTGQWKPLSCTP